MGISTSQYTLFFSLYSFPNIVVAFFFGFFADRFGRRISIIACGIFIFVGEAFFAFGIIKRVFALAAIGRFIYGIGAEPHSGSITYKFSHCIGEFILLELSIFTYKSCYGCCL